MGVRRRQVIKWGLGAGALAAAGVGRRVFTSPRPSEHLAPVPELATRLYDALGDDERPDAVVAYDDPLRQLHNPGLPTAGGVALLWGSEARALAVDLFHAALSDEGRRRIPEQFLLRWLAGIHSTRVLFCGQPTDEHWQVIITGAHLNLRVGGRNREGVAFGGPQVYGDQRGDGKVGLPNNIYRYQLELGQRLFDSLSPGERQRARQPVAPPQTAIEVQGTAGRFEGIQLAELSADKRQQARAIIAAILDNYHAADVAYAWECIEANGGIESFHLADYDRDFQGGRSAGDGPSQIFRLEAPGAVFHWRGEPHLHAFFNVAMDAENPLSVGEDLGVNPVSLRGAGVARFFEAILTSQADVDFAYYPEISVAGRLRQGPIRTGDIYNLDNWGEQVAVIEVRGDDLRGEAGEVARRATKVIGGQRYRIATISHVADNPSDFGIRQIEMTRYGDPLRDATIDYLRTRGFPEVCHA